MFFPVCTLGARQRSTSLWLTGVIVLLSVVVTAGCVNPTHDQRRIGTLRNHVDNELLARSDYQLAPAQLVSHRSATETVAMPDIVNWNDGLSEEEACAIGIWNHPGYQELLADLQITRADVIEAAQVANPQIATMIPVGPKQWEFALALPLDALWLRPIRVAAAQAEAHRVAERLVQDGLNTIRDIRLSYIDWNLAQQRAAIATEILELRDEVQRIADARLQAGDAAELEVTTVRIDAAVGKADQRRAIRDAQIAQERLRYTLGLQHSDIKLNTESPTLPINPAITLLDPQQLVTDAISSRPDLRAIRLAVRAANHRQDLARKDIWRLSGLLPDINSRGRNGFEAGPGFQFNLPIFHQNQGAAARACAQAEQLKRRFANQRDLVSMEVRQAFLQLQQAEQDLAIWRDSIVPQADAAVQSAQQALRENGVSSLLVLETTRQLLNARQRLLDADAQFRRAIAELERSTGRRLSNYNSVAAVEPAPLPDLHPEMLR
ncbi:MAG: TolC family protein [Pirellulaceae bacterium]|nr:TolC family protein [Pirellulaceae bacterium]